MLTIDDLARDAARDLRASVAAAGGTERSPLPSRKWPRRSRRVVPALAFALSIVLVVTVVAIADGGTDRPGQTTVLSPPTTEAPSTTIARSDADELAARMTADPMQPWDPSLVNWLTLDFSRMGTVVGVAEGPNPSGSGRWWVRVVRTDQGTAVCHWAMDRGGTYGCARPARYPTTELVGMDGLRLVVRAVPDQLDSAVLVRNGVEVPMEVIGEPGGRVAAALLSMGEPVPVLDVVGRAGGEELFRDHFEAAVIPDVVGMTFDDAFPVLREAKVSTIGGGLFPTSRITGTDPPAGTKDLNNDSIQVFGTPSGNGIDAPVLAAAEGAVPGVSDWKLLIKDLNGSPALCWEVWGPLVQGTCADAANWQEPVLDGTNTARFVMVGLNQHPGAAATVDFGQGPVGMDVVETDGLRVAFAIIPKGTPSLTVRIDGTNPISWTYDAQPVPDVNGMTMMDARKALEAAGYFATSGQIPSPNPIVRLAEAPGTRDLSIEHLTYVIE